MQGRWDGELVGVGVIAVRAVEVQRIASEDGFGEGEGGATDVIFVAAAAVEDGRVQDVLDVIEDLRGDIREIGAEERGVGGGGGDEGGREDEAFVGVVANHDFDGFVKGALEQEFAGQGGHEEAVDDGAVVEDAVARPADLDEVGHD